MVREPGQLHGRTGLDDGGRDRANHRRGRSAWLARRTSGIDNPGRRGAVRRNARLRTFQPAGGEDLSRRRRQPADRPAGRLVPAAARLAPAIRRRPAVAALLSDGRDRYLVAADGEGRAVLGSAPLALLPARHRQRLFGVARGERGIRAQYRACRIGDRLGDDLFGRNLWPAFSSQEAPRRPW